MSGRPIIGVTGVEASGKTYFASLLGYLGADIFDADRECSRIKSNMDVINAISNICPEAIVNKEVNNSILRRKIGKLGKDFLLQIENIIHPRISFAIEEFCDKNTDSVAIVLDIPLLFETGLQRLCDLTVAISTPASLIEMRLFERGLLEDDSAGKILAERHFPQEKKNTMADIILPGDCGREIMYKVASILLSKTVDFFGYSSNNDFDLFLDDLQACCNKLLDGNAILK